MARDSFEKRRMTTIRKKVERAALGTTKNVGELRARGEVKNCDANKSRGGILVRDRDGEDKRKKKGKDP